MAVFLRGKYRERARLGYEAKRYDGLEHRVLRLRQLQFVEQFGIAKGDRRLRFVDDLTQLFGAQQRHGGHRNEARFDYRQPCQRHVNRVAAAQQDAVAGHQPEVFHQDLGDAVHTIFHIGIGQCNLG